MRAWTTRLTGVSAVLFVALAWFIATPSAQSSRAIELSLAHFEANRGSYGLSNPSAELRVRRSRSDLSGVTHVRFDQVYRGRPVFEGEAITHVDAAGEVTVTNALHGIINLDTNARVGRNAAVQTAIRDIGPLGSYELRDASLWVLPLSQRSVVDRLVWQVAVLVENDLEDPAEWRYFIDAHNGSVVWAFDALETGTAALGTGKTMYTGDKAVNTDSASGTYYLRDLTRGLLGGNYTCDKNGKTNAPQCGTFSRSNNIFGNNQKNSSDRATAGADAHFGLQATWDYYKNTFGRTGIDNNNRRTYSRVHYGTNYQNAFWSNSCFCMTYGDGGSTFYPLVSVDVAGHEMSHGVMSTEANLTYSGESGGLNESNSDIFGTMVEYAVGSTTDVADYWIGERIYKSNYSTGTYQQNKALRYMDDPFKDGRSPACWSSGLGSLDVHYSSGPNNHMYYLLAQGGTSKCNSNVVGGIGQDKAARIWYKAISEYMTSSTNYHGARTACLQAATSLYPSDPAPYNAVNAAFAAINVTGP